MRIEFDPVKNTANIKKHGISLDMALEIDIEESFTLEDNRGQYGEFRFQMFCPIKGRLHIMIFTFRENVYRVISLRKANDREIRRYKNARETQKK